MEDNNSDEDSQIPEDTDNTTYLEIRRRFELERMQKENEIEERLKRDIDLAKSLSLEQDELEEIASDTSDSKNNFLERPYLNRHDRNRSNHDYHDEAAAASVEEDETDFAYELRVLMERGIIKDDHLQTRYQNGHRSPQPKRHPPRDYDYKSDSRNSSAATALELDENKIFTNGLLMDFLKPYAFDNDGIPKNWNKDKIPTSASGQLYTLNELYPGQDEYETIATDFYKADLEIVKLERLQNVNLLRLFKTEQELLLTQRPKGFQLNTRYLYHGTTVDKLRICEEGLDARLSTIGLFGRGIYFSDNPKKCIQYAGRSVGNDGRYPFILMCRVILGHAKEYPKGERDHTLKREPEKETHTDGWKYYDSVKGCPVDFNEFVVYENRRIMIEYIITFRTKERTLPIKKLSNSSLLSPAAVVAASREALASSANDDVDDPTVDDLTTYPNMTPDLWEHMQRIEIVRESVRRRRAEENGQIYKGLTNAQKRKDRLLWMKVLKINGTPEPDDSDNESSNPEVNNNNRQNTATASSRENTSSAVAEGNSFSENLDIDSVKQVEDMLITDFLSVTATDERDVAKLYLERCAMNLDQAISLYFEEQ